MLPEKVDVACPEDNSQMMLRNGRFGPFLASMNYPDVTYVINLDKKGFIKLPAPPPLKTDLPCPRCEAPLYLRRGKRGPWLGCSTFPKCRGRATWSKLDEAQRKTLEDQLADHEKQHPPVILKRMNGDVIGPQTLVADLIITGGEQKLDLYEENVPRAKSA